MLSNSQQVPEEHPLLKLPSFYKLLDMAACKKAVYKRMDSYQQQRKKGDKRITSNTFDLLFAILRSIPATMEDMRIHQKELFVEAIEQQQFFCFTTTQSLLTMANNTQEYKHIRMCKKTVYNHIELLMKVGIITRKENYGMTGYRNPRPDEMNTNGRHSGRGKMKLYLSPHVIHTKLGTAAPSDSPPPSFFADKGESLPQYILSKESTLQYKNTDTKTIINTPSTVDKNKAFAVAKNSPLNIKNTGRESKPLPSKVAKIPCANLSWQAQKEAKERQQRERSFLTASKRDEERVEQQQAARLWDFMCEQLYPEQIFNAIASTQSIKLLQARLKEAKIAIQQYLQEQIHKYKQNPAYLAAKNKPLAIGRLQKQLPRLERSAFVVVSNMIVKERKYSLKNRKHGLEDLWFPTEYLTSKAANKALNYSKQDWLQLQQKYYSKNAASQAYFEHKNWIAECYYNRVLESHKEGIAIAQKTAQSQYKKWFPKIQHHEHLSHQQKQELDQLFKDTMQSIFNTVTI